MTDPAPIISDELDARIREAGHLVGISLPAMSIINDLRAELRRLRADNAKLREALQPFADRVFNDNGNITVSGNVSYDDHCRAYFTLRALTTGATK